MNFLPSKILELSTKLSPAQVNERIISNIIATKQERFMEYNKLFKGFVLGHSFKLSRVFTYRNSFQADIFGKVEAKGNETLVEINMKLQPFVSIFLIIWCGIAGFAFFVILIASINNPKSFFGCLFPLIMLAFAYGLAKISFNSDAETSKKILIEILEATERA